MKATVFDYGAGNLHSLGRALSSMGLSLTTQTDPLACAQSDELLVLPGVGAFELGAERLKPGLRALRAQLAQGRPCIGICLGMQLMFESSEEGPGEGLGHFTGTVTRLKAKRVPHIGWTKVGALPEMYFAHSFACRAKDERDVTHWAEHGGDRFAAIVRRGKTVGVQFHPEKSSAAGLKLLRQLIDEVTK